MQSSIRFGACCKQMHNIPSDVHIVCCDALKCFLCLPHFAITKWHHMTCHSLCFGSHFEKVAFQTSRGCKHRSWTALCAQPAVVEKSKSRHPQYLSDVVSIQKRRQAIQQSAKLLSSNTDYAAVIFGCHSALTWTVIRCLRCSSPAAAASCTNPCRSIYLPNGPVVLVCDFRSSPPS